MNQDRIVSILFADVKGYSKLDNDREKVALLTRIREDVTKRVLTADNYFFINTWGDGFIICSYSAVDAAETALRMRDFVRTTDWKAAGFSQEFAFRVGLHTQQVKVIMDTAGVVKDVIGVGVDTAARIEPIADPESVFCSDMFYRSLMQQNPQKITAVSVGRRQLAKNYGEMELYQLMWKHEQQTASTTSPASKPVPLPKVQQHFGDKQRLDFLRSAYEAIKAYFQSALTQLEAHQPGVETDFQEITNVKFVCEVYLHGRSRNKCKIWLGGHSPFGYSIGYMEGQLLDISADNSWNEMIEPADDGSAMYLKLSLGDVFNDAASGLKTKANVEQVAEHLWIRFIRLLEST